jgi:uncharacterized coiled-coil protein SlyX
MTQDANQHQVPTPRWMPQAPRSTEHQLLQQRIDELEEQIKAYEQLLDELPELFERKFQQRLQPLIERCQLLSHQLDSSTKTRFIPLCSNQKSRAGFRLTTI